METAPDCLQIEIHEGIYDNAGKILISSGKGDNSIRCQIDNQSSICLETEHRSRLLGLKTLSGNNSGLILMNSFSYIYSTKSGSFSIC